MRKEKQYVIFAPIEDIRNGVASYMSKDAPVLYVDAAEGTLSFAVHINGEKQPPGALRLERKAATEFARALVGGLLKPDPDSLFRKAYLTLPGDFASGDKGYISVGVNRWFASEITLFKSADAAVWEPGDLAGPMVALDGGVAEDLGSYIFNTFVKSPKEV